MSFILASSSPRRQELLQSIYHREFSIIAPTIDESKIKAKFREDLPLNIALAKLQEVAKDHTDDIVFAADTMVFLQNRLLGKPHTVIEADEMLHYLQNNIHRVITGYAIYYNGQIYSGKSVSAVKIFPMTDKEINDYIKTGAPFDKAGGYGIQDTAIKAEVISGSFFNVMGLPVEDIRDLFTTLQINCL